MSYSDFKIGRRVSINCPNMTRPSPSKEGTIIGIDGAYINVHPDKWPEGTWVEFFINEIKVLKE